MAYFNTIHSPSTFRRKALSEGAKNLISLLDTKKPTPVSSWGRKQLLALRVLCRPLTKERNLPLLEPYLPKDVASINPRIQALIRGPDQGMGELCRMSEPQIYQLYKESEALGFIWTTLGGLLRPPVNQPQANQDSHGQQEDSGHHDLSRACNQPISYIPEFYIGSDEPSSSQCIASSTNSVGYTETPQNPAVEDLALSLIKLFVRLVLNNGQSAKDQ